MITPARRFAGRPLELGFLSPHNAHDRRAFSGTPFFAARALEKRPDIRLRILGSHRAPRKIDRLLRRHPSDIAVNQIDLTGLDAVVGVVATPLLDQLMRQTSLPVLHVTDATPTFLRETYGWSIPSTADIAETRVVAKAAATIYSSPEMAARAPRDLGLPRLAAEALPFGVNFDVLPTEPPKKPPLDKINLLFVGMDWERKGGDIAVAALDQLLAQGQAAHLTIVGRCPERHLSHPAITFAGFLNKNRSSHAVRLTQLYASAHLLVLPSRGDCTPMVVAEAMAHGTPVVATDIGGMRSLIGGNGAGRLMALHSDPADWARAIREMTTEPAYAFLLDACFERGHDVLSWDAWAEGVNRLTRKAVTSGFEEHASAA